MAITRVGIMANPPTNIDDYTHILAHLDAYAKQVGNQGMLLTQWGNTSGVPAIAKGSYISHGGTLFVVDTEDFLVTAPASNGTYYLRVAGSGASLAISWVTSIGGYTWNAIYNGLYDGSENQILPYMLIKTGATLEKWKITNLMQGGGFNRVDYLGRVIMGALTCASVDTGSGPMTFNQGVKTTDTVGFVNIKPSFIPALNAGDVTIIPGIAGSTSGTTALNTWVDVPSGSSNIKFDNALAPNTAIYSYRMNIYFGMVNHGSPSGKIRVKKNGIIIYTSGSITAGDYSTGVYVSSIDVVYNIADVFTFEVYRTTTASGDHSVRIYCDFGVDREYTALENKLGNLILI